MKAKEPQDNNRLKQFVASFVNYFSQKNSLIGQLQPTGVRNKIYWVAVTLHTLLVSNLSE